MDPEICGASEICGVRSEDDLLLLVSPDLAHGGKLAHAAEQMACWSEDFLVLETQKQRRQGGG